MVEQRRMIPLTKPWMDEREAAAAARPIMAGWVTQGPEVAAFEAEFAAYAGAAHACAVANCTVALHLALRGVGVVPGDEVITVSHSFVATASSVRYCGAIPVFVDIEPGTFNIDPRLIEHAITSRTRAILCVHQLGMPCDLAAITAIARRYGLAVVEDAACAVGSEILWAGEWQRIGRPHGDVACFSFHPRKLLTTGDGGMLTTARPELDQQFRLWRQHAMSLPDTLRHGARGVLFEEYTELGFNYRLSDIQAAVGREQLQRLPTLIDHRRAQAGRYRELLALALPEAGLPAQPDWARSNWQSFCVRLPDGADQRAVMQALLDSGVATRRGVMCAHREPAYAREPWGCGPNGVACGCEAGRCRRLFESERAQDRAIMLPLFHQLTEDEQEHIAEALARACRKA